MTDVHAAIGLAQIRRYDQILARRKEIIEKYDAEFDKLPVEKLKHYTDAYQSSGHLYIIRLTGKNREQTNEFITKMAELGIATNVHYKPIPLHTGYIDMGMHAVDYPNCVEQFGNEVTLPLHTVLSNEDVEYIIWGVKKIYKELFGQCA